MDRDGRKTGGRVKGIPNRRAIDARALAERMGVDPLEILLMFAGGDARSLGYVSVDQAGNEQVGVIPPELRFAAAREAANYIYPKRKALEVSPYTEEKKSIEQIISEMEEW